MTRDEVLERIHEYAQWVTFTAEDGYPCTAPSSRKQYEAQYAQATHDLLPASGLVPAEDVTADVFYRYQHMGLWAESDLLMNPDPRIRRDVEYDIARRKGRMARNAWHMKWAEPLPGDEVIR